MTWRHSEHEVGMVVRKRVESVVVGGSENGKNVDSGHKSLKGCRPTAGEKR